MASPSSRHLLNPSRPDSNGSTPALTGNLSLRPFRFKYLIDSLNIYLLAKKAYLFSQFEVFRLQAVLVHIVGLAKAYPLIRKDFVPLG